MFSGVCFGTNDLVRAGEFYDRVLSTIGVVRLAENDNEIGYGVADGEPTFWVLIPFDKKSATHGNGTQVIFSAEDSNAVGRFHATAMESGGSDEGAPGPRDYAPGYYGAYCRDPDGNKLHVFVMLDEAGN